MPLLDDHQPGDEPLTQAQARNIADNLGIFAQDLENYEVTAQLTACLPAPEQVSWWFAGDAQTGESTGYRYSAITRLGWSFRYDGEIDGFADSYWICIDLYTGEVLSIDVSA